MLVVEDVITKKRVPVHSRDKVVSLGDISMYTMGDDKPLSEILELVREYAKGEKLDYKGMDNDTLRTTFGEILHDFDRDRVYPSDIKKLFSWYNILTESGMTEFVEKAEEAVTPAEESAEA